MRQEKETTQNRSPLADLLERARRVLLHEQRTGHADIAVRPGGISSFIVHMGGEIKEARTRGMLPAGALSPDAIPVEQALAELFREYQLLDPMRRAANVRLALSLLERCRAPVPTPREVAPGPPISPLPASSPTPPSLALPRARQRPEKTATAPLPPRPENEYLLRSPVTVIQGVGPTQAGRLQRLGITTVTDLLFTFPHEHHDYSALDKIADLPFGEIRTTVGLIWEVANHRTNGGRIMTVARINDETGTMQATWFNQPYLQKQLTRGAYIVVTGIKQRFGNRVEFSVRSHELPEKGDLINTGRLVPVYGLTEGLSPKVMRRITKWAVDHCARLVPEHLPATLRTRARLMNLPEAVAQMHYPDSAEQLAEARHRLAFDELFLIQLGMLTRRARRQEGPPAPQLRASSGLIFAGGSFDAETSVMLERPNAFSGTPVTFGEGLWPLTAQCLEETLPFRFTGAQRRAIGEILADLGESTPMARLLEGDVGSGKTVVAAAALLVAAASGYQGALLAPTEILAEQHYRSLSTLLAPFGLRVALLTGRQRAREREVALHAASSGEAAVVIGTHALIQEGVAFRRMGLAIVDEQHRFGVEQRDSLREKGHNPHMLVMTATPIPRTLALTLYGDLDVSLLDEMPPGRKPIITRWRSGSQRQEAYRLVAEEIGAGRQAYIICPLVEESEALEAKSAIAEYERLRTAVFPELRLGLVHGQLRPVEKDSVMRAFRDGTIDILVATAVVEVGVDVPNATVMLIEDADRFGLSQVHQFRGRVGRGEQQSYCYLLSQDAGAVGRERLSMLERTSDGFRLAEEDLRLRGAGDFFGTRQSGLPALKVASLADTQLLVEARSQAEWLWRLDPFLGTLEHAALREKVFLFWRDFAAH